MKNEKEENFRKLIEASLEQPPTGFTEQTMNLVQAEARQAIENEMAVQALLRQPGLVERPSPDFSRLIMGEVEVLQATKAEPIVPKRAWYLVAASVVLMILGCFLIFTPATTLPTPSGMDILLIGITGQLEGIPVLYPLTIIAVSLLMLGDYFLRPRIINRFQVLQ